MNIGHEDLFPQSDIPHVVSLIDHFRVDVELQRLSEGTSDPKRGHIDNNVVLGVRSCKFGEISSGCLCCIIYIVCVKNCI